MGGEHAGWVYADGTWLAGGDAPVPLRAPTVGIVATLGGGQRLEVVAYGQTLTEALDNATRGRDGLVAVNGTRDGSGWRVVANFRAREQGAFEGGDLNARG
jgi:hypothetical protein